MTEVVWTPWRRDRKTIPEAKPEWQVEQVLEGLRRQTAEQARNTEELRRLTQVLRREGDA